jgi:hypothetical protein
VSPRVFIVLLLITVFAIWVGDTVAQDFAAPGLERTFAVLVVAAAIVAPCAWLFGKLGWIRRGNVEIGRKRAADDKPASQRDGGAA